MVEMLSLNYRRRPPPPDPPVVEGINLRELYIEYAGVRTGNQHGSKRMEKISRCRSRGAVTLVEAMSQCISDSECEGFLFGIIENCPPCTDDKRFFFKVKNATPSNFKRDPNCSVWLKKPETSGVLFKKLQRWFNKLNKPSLDVQISVMKCMREGAQIEAINTAMLKLGALEILCRYALPSADVDIDQVDRSSDLRFHASLTTVTIAGHCAPSERQLLVAAVEGCRLLEVLLFLYRAIDKRVEVHPRNLKQLRDLQACMLVSKTLLNLSKTSRKTVRVGDKSVSIRTINPIIMSMSEDEDHEDAITILLAMCRLGCNDSAPVDADYLDVPLSSRTKAASSADAMACSAAVDTSSAAASTSMAPRASAAKSATWSVDGAEDAAFTGPDSVEAAHLATRALAQIAEDDWCREPLVQKAGVLPVLVSLLRSGDRDLQLESASAVVNLSDDPLHNLVRYSSLRTDFIEESLEESHWKPLEASQCGWIGEQIVSAGALVPLLELLRNETGTSKDVLVFVVKILCNLSSKGPNRKKMVQEGFVPVLTKALGNQLLMVHESDSFVIKNVQITEDLLVTLSCMSRTTPATKRMMVKNGFIEPLIALLDDDAPERILMTALEVICSLSECSENVADLVEAPYALDKIAALARYANTEMQFLISKSLGNLLSDTSLEPQSPPLYAPERKLLLHLMRMGRNPDDNTAVRLEVLRGITGLAESIHRANTRRIRKRRELKRFRRTNSGRIESRTVTLLRHGSKDAGAASSSSSGLSSSAGLDDFPSSSPMPLSDAVTSQDTGEYHRAPHGREVDAIKYGWEKAVPRLVRELQCENELLRTEAARGITVLANLSRRLQQQLVKNQALKLLAELLQDPSSSADLKKEANAAVVAMGFKDGVEDLEHCGGGLDIDLMHDWFEIDVMVRKQRLSVAYIRHLASQAWTHNTSPIHRRKSSPDVLLYNRKSSEKRKMRRNTEGSLRDSPAPSDKDFVSFSNNFTSDCSSDESSSELSDTQDTMKTPQIDRKTSNLNSNSATKTSSSHRSTPSSVDAHMRARTSADCYEPRPDAGALPPLLQEQLSLNFPSRLRQQLLLPSPLFKRPRQSRQLLRARVEGSDALHNMDTLAILMPANRPYYSFQFSKVLTAILRKYARQAHDWCLSFRDCGFHASFCSQFTEALQQFPQIESLSFSLKQNGGGTNAWRCEEMDRNLVDLLVDLPAWIQWVTFDSCFKHVGTYLERLCDSLRVRVDNHYDLTGLAITNNGLHESNIAPLVKFLEEITVPSDEAAPIAVSEVSAALPASTPRLLRGLQWLDLNGNSLGDKGVAKVFRALKGNCFLRGIDVSHNRMRSARKSMEALCGRHPSATDLGSELLSNPSLTALRLADNGLKQKDVRPLLEALALNIGELRYLDLSNNRIKDVKNVVQKNRTLYYLNLQNNKLTAACGQSLSTWIRKSHKNLCFLLVGGNRNVSTVHHFRCQEFTARNRQQRYAAMDAADSPRTPDNMKKKRWPLIPLGCNELPIKKKNSQDASTPQKPPTVAPEMSDASSVTTDNDNGIEQKAPVAPERSDASSVATDNDNGIEQKAPVAPERSDASSVATDNGNNIDAVDTNTSASQQSTATASDMWTATAPDTDMWTLNESYDPKRPSPINCSTPSQTPSASSEALTTPSVGRTPSTSKGNRRSARVSLLLSTPLVSTDEFKNQVSVDRLEFEHERELLRRALRQSGKAIHLNVRRATQDNFREELTNGCRILHYSGHGERDCLCFEDMFGGMKRMTAEDLKNLVRVRKPQLQLVIISACNSRQTAQAFIDAGVPHVCCVKIDAKLHDTHAVNFSRHLYLALGKGFSINDAFQIAKSNIKFVEARKFLLLPAGDDHSEKIFADVSPAREWDRLTPRSSFIPPPSFPNICEQFHGRNSDVYRVLTAVLTQNFVTLHGEQGSGKTSTAAAVCHYLWQRRSYIGGHLPYWAHFVRLEGHRSTLDVVLGLLDSVSNDAEVLADLGLPHNDMRHSTPKKEHDASETRARSGSADGNESRSTRKSKIAAYTKLLLQRLRKESQRGGSSNILLILDHCDDVLQYDAIHFRTLLATLLREGRRIKILAVSCTPIQGVLRGSAIMEQDYKLQGLKAEDAMSLLLRCCPDAHAAIRLPLKLCDDRFSSSDEDSDDEDDPSVRRWTRLVMMLRRLPALQELRPYYPADIYKTAYCLRKLRRGLLGLLKGGKEEEKAVRKIAEKAKKDRNSKS